MNNSDLNMKIKLYIKQKTLENLNSLSEKEIFLKAVYDTLTTIEEEHSELILANYENPEYNLRVDGYDYVTENKLDLFIADYSAQYKNIDSEYILEKIESVKKYIERAMDDLYEYLDHSTEISELTENIKYNDKKIKEIRTYFITNNIYNDQEKFDFCVRDKKINVKIIDLKSINELSAFQNDEDQIVNVDFREICSKKIYCIKNNVDFERFDNYLFFMPAYALAKTYETHGYSFLDGNVRAYLKKTQKVNKQIYQTIVENPNYFVAYNNGLSTVASNIDIDEKGEIRKIYGWQIVNGGQTTATIYEALKNNLDLSNVYVPTKLTLLNHSNENNAELIEKISEYANTQSKVNQSDFSSNEKFHVEIEKLSKKICIPNDETEEFEKWFYERTKGQYDLNKSRDVNKVFVSEFPKNKKFNKVEMAKTIMSWEQEPYTVSLGGENNFLKFNNRVKVDEVVKKVNEEFYKRMIGAIILFKEIDKIVGKESFGGYKANITTYTFSLLSYLTKQKLNLLKIWKLQDIDDNLRDFIKDLSHEVYDEITDTPSNNKNVAMWCRNEDCWKNVKEIEMDVEDIDSWIEEKDFKFVPFNSIIVSSGNSIDVKNVTSNEWFALSRWGKETDLIQPTFRKAAYSMGTTLNKGKKLTLNQISFAKSILKDAYDKGFKYEDNGGNEDGTNY